MANEIVDVTVHIDETLDQARLGAIAERVRNASGVASAVYHDSKPHFLLVTYNPSRISSDAVHRLVTDQGVHAEMIGI